MNSKYLKLLDLLKETGFTLEEVANCMNISRQSLYNKIYGLRTWKFDEMITLKNIINGTLNKNYILEDIFAKTEKSEKK